ncbi:tetratricopeptide repeat protein, partial [Planctomycetota bacterium]
AEITPESPGRPQQEAEQGASGGASATAPRSPVSQDDGLRGGEARETGPTPGAETISAGDAKPPVAEQVSVVKEGSSPTADAQGAAPDHQQETTPGDEARSEETPPAPRDPGTPPEVERPVGTDEGSERPVSSGGRETPAIVVIDDADDEASAAQSASEVGAREKLLELMAALEKSPAEVPLLLEAATHAYALGERASARRLCERALEADPLNAGALNDLAVLLTEAGEFARAEALLKEALALQPSVVEAYVNLGNLHLRRGDLRMAELSYRTGLRVQPGHGIARLNLVRVLEQADRVQEAVQEAELLAADSVNGSTVDPEAVAALRGRLLIRTGECRQAVEVLERTLAKSPDRASVATDLGVAYMHLDRFDAARAVLDSVVARWPDHAPAYNNRGMVYSAQARNSHGADRTAQELYRSAGEDYLRAMELDPDYADAHFNYALLAEEYRHYVVAIEEYERVLVIDPHHTSALNNLANLYIRAAESKKASVSERRSHLERALGYLEGAIEAEPDRPPFYYNRGLALLLLGRTGEASAAFDRYLSLLPEGPDRVHERTTIVERLRKRR